MRIWLRFLRRYGRAIALAASLAFVVRLAAPAPPPRTLEGLAAMFGRAVDGVVAPSEIAWEPSPGFVTEAILGRSCVFLAAPRLGAPRDLYRAWVRVSLDGKPIAVRKVRNLTRTPLGDDRGLRLSAGRAAVATTAFGRIQAVSLFELDGIRDADRPSGWLDRLLVMLDSYRLSGSFAGVGRTDVIFDLPGQTATIALGPSSLRVDLGSKGRELVVDLESRRARGADGGEAYAARVLPHVHGDKPLIVWLVDTVRDYVGPTPIAWLENRVFGARDSLKRTAYSIFSSETARQLKPPEQRSDVAARSREASDEAGWPPAPIPSLWREPKTGEGEWEPVTEDWLPSYPKNAPDVPPYFYRTFIRPDPDRPYSEVLLIALDMRRLRVDIEAGYEDPEPLTGPPGAGRIPRDPEILERVVATFNGAFKTTHGEYGMMVRRRVLLPPTPGAATIVTTHDGEIGFGNWPDNKQLPGDVVSFRQNLDPLVEDGVANPTGRHIWGWQLAGQGVLTERTALCLSSAGHVYYAWGREISGPRLAHALRQAGCDYAVHLDMNPKHCGFVFTRIGDVERKEMTLKLADPDMSINPSRYVLWSQKDFFYVTLRDPLPPPTGGIDWRPGESEQPAPSWLPAQYRATVRIGGLDVQVLDFEKGRFDWLVRAGRAEPQRAGKRPKKYDVTDEQAARLVGAVGLGHTTDATSYGLAFDGAASIELRNAYASLIVAPGRLPEILPPGKSRKLAADEDSVQLPLIADGGEVLPAGRVHGAMRTRGGLCVTPFGRLLFAMVHHDSDDPVALALLKAGCQRVVSTDRGSKHPAFTHLAGTDTPPLRSYETSVLYLLARPMQPHAFRWRPRGSKRAVKPTGFDR